ncbi:MAG: ThuA domain-containing protein [Verrucomicrobia bacterium]|nr:ThuA domain-containing protein [Verrucomicrobiota bacterium]
MNQKNALIVWGGWEGHQPGQCAARVEKMLVEEGFAVERENQTGAFADPDLTRFDLIIPIFSMGSITDAESKSLCAAVESGVGLAGFHGGMGDSFRLNTDYQFMTGGQWVAHPGNIISYRVNIVDKSDPITQGIEDFIYESEQYYMHVDPSNHVLATTTFSGDYCFWIKGVRMPVVWKRMHGRGKVFYSSLGHLASEFAVGEMATLLRRGMLWATREKDGGTPSTQESGQQCTAS